MRCSGCFTFKVTDDNLICSYLLDLSSVQILSSPVGVTTYRWFQRGGLMIFVSVIAADVTH